MGRLSLAARVGRELRAHGYSLSVAESLTGGLVSHLLTEVPGASDYLKLGVVSYAVNAKARVLGVAPELLSRGVVSEAVAVAMAEGVRRLGDTEIGLGLTGIAGPGGAELGKPVGLTYIAVAGPAGPRTQELFLSGGRSRIKREAAQAVLRLLLAYLGP